MKFIHYALFFHSTTACFWSKPAKKPHETVTPIKDYPTRINNAKKSPKKESVKKLPMNYRKISQNKQP